MAESGDFDPGPWTGHDFKSAHAHYDAYAGRSYTNATASGKSPEELLEATITTNAHNPLVIFTDITGSMGEWPAWMFSKLPYLELEGKEYLGEDLEIAFGAFGDAHCGSTYAVQMRPFTSGTDLKVRMEELVIEGGGGGTLEESSDLAALYCLHNVAMPNAIRPILVIVTDEMPYDVVSPEVAEKFANVKLERRMTVEEIFAQLKQRFAVYVVRKPYEVRSDNEMSDRDRRVYARWVELVGASNVKDLADAQRIVDVIFGIMAIETGRFGYFRTEIEGRQRPDQVATVYKSLGVDKVKELTAGSDDSSGKSISLLEDPNCKKSKRLL